MHLVKIKNVTVTLILNLSYVFVLGTLMSQLCCVLLISVNYLCKHGIELKPVNMPHVPWICFYVSLNWIYKALTTLGFHLHIAQLDPKMNPFKVNGVVLGAFCETPHEMLP